MVNNQDVLNLPKGATVQFDYRFPQNGPYKRKGQVEEVVNFGEHNMIRGGKLRFYGINPVRPKGKVMLKIFDSTVNDYRSFYTEYMDNLIIT